MDFKLNLDSELVECAYPAEPLAVEPHIPVREVFRILREQQVGSLMVCHDGVLAGIFTERDALQLIASGADLDVPIESVMVTGLVTVRKSDTVGTAIRKMASGGYRRLPIVDESGRPVGMVKASGIVHYLVEHFPSAVYNLPPEPNPVTQEREGA